MLLKVSVNINVVSLVWKTVSEELSRPVLGEQFQMSLSDPEYLQRQHAKCVC